MLRSLSSQPTLHNKRKNFFPQFQSNSSWINKQTFLLTLAFEIPTMRPTIEIYNWSLPIRKLFLKRFPSLPSSTSGSYTKNFLLNIEAGREKYPGKRPEKKYKRQREIYRNKNNNKKRTFKKNWIFEISKSNEAGNIGGEKFGLKSLVLNKEFFGFSV